MESHTKANLRDIAEHVIAIRRIALRLETHDDIQATADKGSIGILQTIRDRGTNIAVLVDNLRGILPLDTLDTLNVRSEEPLTIIGPLNYAAVRCGQCGALCRRDNETGKVSCHKCGNDMRL